MSFKSVITEGEKGFNNERNGLFKIIKDFEKESKTLSNRVKVAFDKRMTYDDIELDKEVDDINEMLERLEILTDNIRISLSALSQEYYE